MASCCGASNRCGCGHAHHLLYIANSLVDQHIGLEETDDAVWSIYFNSVLIAILDGRDYIIREATMR